VRTLLAMLLAVAVPAIALCSSDGLLTKVTTIQVDPTVVPTPANINDPAAPNLVRFDLRAGVRQSHLLEGNSPYTHTSSWIISLGRTAR
jgi:hypothetical protein